MLHIYTGNGKGKTTAAYGLAMRSNGWKKKICIIQFLKAKDSICGEIITAKKLRFKIICLNQKHPLFCPQEKIGLYKQKLKNSLSKNIKKVKEILKSNRYRLVVLDEIMNAIDQKYLSENDVLDLIKTKTKDTEIVLTGRANIPKRLRILADYITVMQEVKHPFKKRIPARQGIEY